MTMMLSRSIFQKNELDVFGSGIVSHAQLVTAPVSPAFRQYFDHCAFDTNPKSINQISIIESNYVPAQFHRVFSSTKYLEDVNTTKMLCDISPCSPFSTNQSAETPSLLESSKISLQADFEEFSVMGSGNFAEVYCVREKSSGKDYAVKKCKVAFKGQSDREFVLKEVNIMKRVCQLHSPYVLQLVRAWQEDGYLHVQLELAERGTLLGLMNTLSASGQSFPEDTIWRVLHDVGSGLSHIHSCGVIHLDIKPANILISIDGTLMIGDFGNAIFAAEVSQQSDGIEGDNRYFAPELLLYPCVVTSAADVFSFGLTLLELWNFVPGYDGLPGQGRGWQALRNELLTFREGISNQLAETITAMLRHSQDDRPSVDILLKGENVVRVSRLAADPIILLASVQTHITRHQSTSSATTTEGDQEDADTAARMLTPPISDVIWQSRSRSRFQSSLASPSLHRPTGIRPGPLASTANDVVHGKAPSDLFGDDTPFSPFLYNKNKRCNSRSSNKSPSSRRPTAARATPLFAEARKELSTSPPLFKPISMEMDDCSTTNNDQLSDKTNYNCHTVSRGNTLLIQGFEAVLSSCSNNDEKYPQNLATSRTKSLGTPCTTTTTTNTTLLFTPPPPPPSLHSLPTVNPTSSTSTCISSKKGSVLNSEPKTSAVVTAIDLESNHFSMDKKITKTRILTRQKMKEKLRDNNQFT